MKRCLFSGGRVAFFLAALLVGLVLSGQADAADKMPRFALPSAIDGKVVNVDAHKGKVMLVNFFATWCPPCRQEIPSFVRLQDELGPKGFTVIGLSIDDGSAPVARFMDKLGINYPVLMADQKVTAGFGNVVGVPTTFLVDRSGTIVKSYVGYVDHSILKRDIAAVLK